MFAALGVSGGPVSSLSVRGYTALPVPQEMKLESGDFTFSADWRIAPAVGVPQNDVAVESLKPESGAIRVRNAAQQAD